MTLARVAGLALAGLLLTSHASLRAQGSGIYTATNTATYTATAYQDRVIADLPPLPDDDIAPGDYNRNGWPRLLRLETRLGTQPFDDERRERLAYAIYGLIETPNHGALSIDGSITPGLQQQTLTLRQRDLPLPGGWRGDHELGVIGTPATELARLPSRVLLPNANLRGLSGQWLHSGLGLQGVAAHGEPGQLVSLPAAGFQGLGGRRSVLGFQWHLGGGAAATDGDPAGNTGTASVFTTVGRTALARPGWTLALQHESATDVDIPSTTAADGSITPSSRGDARASYLALRHEGADLRTQGQLLSASTGRAQGRANGFWLDSEWDDGPRQHGLSLYRLERGLNWAAQAMPSDLQGLTLRSQWRTRQWSVEASHDWLRSLSGRAADGSYTSGSARWRLSRDHQLGAGLALRRFDGNAWTSYGDWRWLNDWGNTGLRLEIGGGAAYEGPVQFLGYDQEWNAPAGWTLSSSLGLGRYDTRTDSEDGDGESESVGGSAYWSAALAVQAPLSTRASLRGQLSTEQRSQGPRRHNLSLGGQWRLARHWQIDTQYTRSLGRAPLRRPLDPLAPINTETETATSDRSFQAVLRYETEAGTRIVPMGGGPQEGGGRIEGVVYYDANRSGTQDASETGVPGVTVSLDNRYGVRTDAQGRFVFAFVAAGPRTISVRNETLPLPWSVVDDGQVKIEVRLRETTRLSLPVRQSGL